MRIRDVPKGGGGGEIPVTLRSMGVYLGAQYARGTFTARYAPRKLGEAIVEVSGAPAVWGALRRPAQNSGGSAVQVMINGKHVKGGPFTVAVQGGPASAPHCYVRDSDLEGASLRDGAAKRTFAVFACDKSGSRRTVGGDALVALLRGPGEKGGKEGISLKDGKDGTYQGEFVVKQAGRYWLEVSLGGAQIAGSPYVIDFSPDPAEEVSNFFAFG